MYMPCPPLAMAAESRSIRPMVEAFRQDGFPIMREVIRVRFTQVAWPHSVKFLTRGAAARKHHASRLPLSFPHFRGLRELGVARLVRLPRRVVVFPRSGGEVLRDATFRRLARRRAPLQVSHSRERRSRPRALRRDPHRVGAEVRAGLLLAA